MLTQAMGGESIPMKSSAVLLLVEIDLTNRICGQGRSLGADCPSQQRNVRSTRRDRGKKERSDDVHYLGTRGSYSLIRGKHPKCYWQLGGIDRYRSQVANH